MTHRKLKLKDVFLTVEGGTFTLHGRTARGAGHSVEFRLDNIHSLMCGIGKLSDRVKGIIEGERHTHRWARNKLADNWRALNAVVGEDQKP